MSETPVSNPERWLLRRKQLRSIWQRLIPFASGGIAAIAILLLYGLLTPAPPQITTRDVENSIAQAMASATPRPALSAQVYEIVRPSLVLIETDVLPREEGLVEYQPDVTINALQEVQDDGVGSGVIVNDAGDILTSLHVVVAATTIRVTFADGTVSRAEIIGTLSDNDVAVLRASTLPEQIIPATLGNPNAMRIGDEAFVAGHPFGLYGSMSAGVISGFNRIYQPPTSAEPMANLIQFDAATNPGTSGGPLLNRSGQVVGIVTMLLNPTGQDVFVGIGFAVPITAAGGAAGLPPQ
ncbi:MAG: trypsin-like peptidase domain-containing protein [Anaerolineae bacterium]|nr:trypsin-like peptidase domain-containing protein [Anaerolineae bacterium]